MSSLHDPIHPQSLLHHQVTTLSLPLLRLCTSMTQRFILSHFLVILSVQALIQKLETAPFHIRSYLVDWFGFDVARVQLQGG